MSNRRVADTELPKRLRELFGRSGLTQRLMVAFGRGHSSVEDILAGRNVPPEIVWIVELLLKIPVKRWPARWVAARGADADDMRRVGVATVFAEDALAAACAALERGGTYSEAAAILNVSAAHAHVLAARGVLPRSRNRRGRRPAPPDEIRERLRQYQREYRRRRRVNKK